MRRDTKLAIVVAVLFIGLGIWYLSSGGTSERSTNPAADSIRDESQPPSPTAEDRDAGHELKPTSLSKANERPMDRRVDRAQKPQVRNNTGTIGSPSAVNVRDRAVRSLRPQPKETSEPLQEGPLGKPLESVEKTHRPGVGTVTPPDSTDVTRPERALVKERTSIGTVSAKTTDTEITTTRPAGETPAVSERKVTTAVERASPASSATPPAKETIAAKPAMQTHTVKTGETLWAIAAKYLGEGRRYREIVQANPNLDPNRIQAGAKIVIPVAAGAPSSRPSPADRTRASSTVVWAPEDITTVAMKPKPIPPDRAYQVKSGEGWYNLAQRFLGDGNRWPELYELNKGRAPGNPNLLPAGTLIELPKGAKATQ